MIENEDRLEAVAFVAQTAAHEVDRAWSALSNGNADLGEVETMLRRAAAALTGIRVIAEREAEMPEPGDVL